MRPSVVLSAVFVAVAACGGATGTPGAGEPCSRPSGVEDLSLLPDDIPLDKWATVEELQVADGFLGARAITTTPIVELYPVMARATSDAGYTILSGDNEGFEAEIFFERGKGTTGTYRLRQGPCGDQVTIRLLYEADRYRRLS